MTVNRGPHDNVDPINEDEARALRRLVGSGGYDLGSFSRFDEFGWCRSNPELCALRLQWERDGRYREIDTFALQRGSGGPWGPSMAITWAEKEMLRLDGLT